MIPRIDHHKKRCRIGCLLFVDAQLISISCSANLFCNRKYHSNVNAILQLLSTIVGGKTIPLTPQRYFITSRNPKFQTPSAVLPSSIQLRAVDHSDCDMRNQEKGLTDVEVDRVEAARATLAAKWLTLNAERAKREARGEREEDVLLHWPPAERAEKKRKEREVHEKKMREEREEREERWEREMDQDMHLRGVWEKRNLKRKRMEEDPESTGEMRGKESERAIEIGWEKYVQERKDQGKPLRERQKLCLKASIKKIKQRALAKNPAV